MLSVFIEVKCRCFDDDDGCILRSEMDISVANGLTIKRVSSETISSTALNTSRNTQTVETFFVQGGLPFLKPKFQDISRTFSGHFCIFKDSRCRMKCTTYNEKMSLLLIAGGVGHCKLYRGSKG